MTKKPPKNLAEMSMEKLEEDFAALLAQADETVDKYFRKQVLATADRLNTYILLREKWETMGIEQLRDHLATLVSNADDSLLDEWRKEQIRHLRDYIAVRESSAPAGS